MKKQTIFVAAVIAIGLKFTNAVLCEEHHEEYAFVIHQQVVEIEVDLLLKKYREILKRFHQLDLECINLKSNFSLIQTKWNKLKSPDN